MEQIQSERPGRKFLALAFCCPFWGYSLVMLAGRFSPFGSSSIYIPICITSTIPSFVEFRRVLRSGGSLVYNWNLGLGVDYLGLIAYYLASPPEFAVCAGTGGDAFGLFLYAGTGEAGPGGAVFCHLSGPDFPEAGLVHGALCLLLCPVCLGPGVPVEYYVAGYLLPLLPMVMLGMISLLQTRRFFLYTVTLFLSVASNYYIGFFTCIFVALCFLPMRFAMVRASAGFWETWGLCSSFPLLAIALTAFLEWPAYVALGTTNSSVNEFPHYLQPEHCQRGFLEGASGGHGQGGGKHCRRPEPTFKEGLPNLYCGILPLLLLIQLFASKEVRLREKLCTLGMLVFFMLSFILRQLDYIWHGFHFTNMIPYRFSFLFSFVVLVIPTGGIS